MFGATLILYTLYFILYALAMSGATLLSAGGRRPRCIASIASPSGTAPGVLHTLYFILVLLRGALPRASFRPCGSGGVQSAVWRITSSLSTTPSTTSYGPTPSEAHPTSPCALARTSITAASAAPPPPPPPSLPQPPPAPSSPPPPSPSSPPHPHDRVHRLMARCVTFRYSTVVHDSPGK